MGSVLCSEHFKSQLLRRVISKNVLRRNSVSTIFHILNPPPQLTLRRPATKMLLKVSVGFALLTCLNSQGWEKPILGGLQPGHPDSSTVNFAKKKLNESFNNSHQPAPLSVKVIGATSQIVAGVRYGIHFLVERKKTLEICQVFVVLPAWPPKYGNITLDGPITCGIPVEIVAQIESKGNAMSDSAMYMKSIKDPQLVKIFLYLIAEDLILYETNCKKTAKNLSKCKAKPNKPVMRCSGVIVWYGIKFEVHGVTCGNV
ncbi:hypothetical protein PoB_004380100 [Plakobranchus ocellatus]|uniref:Cystatin domain-containing protein n=1 Tax=Plakobranchus ocellatus TaxID=259542 RepID=A0AAV4BES8_9GAST|nr:hypothetical protein PoB_004380100 [Plakobranchus ocellatus]